MRNDWVEIAKEPLSAEVTFVHDLERDVSHAKGPERMEKLRDYKDKMLLILDRYQKDLVLLRRLLNRNRLSESDKACLCRIVEVVESQILNS